jgi:hypothetical protein|tara:strand:- start:20 stop:628 length:609 start_codon:yes stop_codon:yes gene_type:complete
VQGKAGQHFRADLSPDNTTTFVIFIMTTMASDFVNCTFARPAGNKTHLVVLYVAPGHHLEGETVLANLAPGQQWIINLDPGDLVTVRNRLRPGDKGDYLGDACANAKQPLFDLRGKDQQKNSIQTVVDLDAACNSEGRDMPGLLRIDTYLSDSEQIALVERLSGHCTKKEAGHLLLKYAIKNLPPVAKQMQAHDLFTWLNDF